MAWVGSGGVRRRRGAGRRRCEEAAREILVASVHLQREHKKCLSPRRLFVYIGRA
jgi:hypothetical protein